MPPLPSEIDEISEGFVALILYALSSRLYLMRLKVFEKENAEKNRMNKKNAATIFMPLDLKEEENKSMLVMLRGKIKFLVKSYTYQFRYAFFLHCYTIQSASGFHRSLIVSNNNKLCVLAEVIQYSCKAIDVRIIKRGINFIKNTEWTRFYKVNCK